MPGKVAKIGSFSEWVGVFNEWRKEVGVNKDDVEAFHFDTLYGAIETGEIQFGSYKGRNKWENLRATPSLPAWNSSATCLKPRRRNMIAVRLPAS